LDERGYVRDNRRHREVLSQISKLMPDSRETRGAKQMGEIYDSWLANPKIMRL